MTDHQQGWECPRCKAILAPWMPYCNNCKDGGSGPRVIRPGGSPINPEYIESAKVHLLKQEQPNDD